MGLVISVASQKGGVGKTTTALNLGFCLSQQGVGVLLVDADPQGGMELASNLRSRATKGIIDVLRGDCPPAAVATRSKRGGLAVAGIGASSASDAIYLEKRAAEGALADVFLSFRSKFDCVIVDVPAGVGALPMGCLAASDSVIIPMPCWALAVRSLPVFLRLVRYVVEHQNPRLHLEGVVVTMMRRDDPRELESYEDLRRMLPSKLLFDTVIPFDPLFEAASLRSVPVGLLAETKQLNEHHAALARELQQRLEPYFHERDEGGLF